MAAYPVAFEADFVESRSRLTTFFRGIMAIPLVLFGIFYALATGFAVVGAWFAIAFTGRYPDGLFTFVSGFVRWSVQVSAYMYLMTDAYPPFNGNTTDYPVRVSFDGPLISYSRPKTIFRGIIALPLDLLRYYVVGPLLGLGAVGAWFVIVITGKQPRGLQELLELGLSYTARSDGYLCLLTETYPPLQDDSGPDSATTGGGTI